MEIDIQALLLDFGGTLDTGGDHWARVIHDAYLSEGVEVDTDLFKAAYIYGERRLGNLINPEKDTFRDVLRLKLALEMEYISGYKHVNSPLSTALRIADRCYRTASHYTKEARALLENLPYELKIGVVSNFYGNLNNVMQEFGLNGRIRVVVDSGTVGVRKPNPEIFKIAMELLGNPPSKKVLVIGDSYANDIVPARKLGCQNVQIKGRGWYDNADEGATNKRVGSLKEALSLFNLL